MQSLGGIFRCRIGENMIHNSATRRPFSQHSIGLATLLILIICSGQALSATTTPGLFYRYYQSSTPTGVLPDFTVITPAKTGSRANAEFDSVNAAPNNVNPFEPTRNDFWSVQFSGNVTVPGTGTYTFRTGSD